MTNGLAPGVIQHDGEALSNDLRRRLAAVEPRSQRTFTPSLAAIASSAGCYHWTSDGRKLADFTSGVLVANLGHNPVGWWHSVWRLLGLDHLPAQRGGFAVAAPLTTYNALSELEVKASERLLACLQAEPGGGRCEQVLWAGTGSEAVQKALWSALARCAAPTSSWPHATVFTARRAWRERPPVAESDPDRDPRVRFISFPREECRDTAHRRQPLDLSRYETELTAIANEYSGRLCVSITEPYLGGGGSYHPQPEYLQLLERFCREHGIAFILDEIQSGFGRTGPMFAFTRYGVEPDLVCLGKGLGNGVPVAAVAGRADILGSLGYGAGSDTFSGNPLAAAAVLATLEEFDSTPVINQAQALAAIFETALERLQELPAVARVRGEGLVWGVEFAELGPMSSAEVAARRGRGLLSGRCPWKGDPPAGPAGRQRRADRAPLGDGPGRSPRVSASPARHRRQSPACRLSSLPCRLSSVSCGAIPARLP